MTKRFFALILTLLLTSCAVPGARSQVVSRTSLPLEPVGTYSLRGNPNFSTDRLPSEMELWHKRLWEGIEYANNSEESLNPETRASSGDLFSMGRFLNVHITTLLSALRVTKDLALLDEVDRLMEMARAELADTNADGFQNWRYLNEATDSSRSFYNDDFHEMDEILTHSMVAAVAYALSENAPFDRRYEEHAQFWLDYLKNDFEAKWRKRNNKRSGFPFIEHKLMHPTLNMIRYHYYMYKLTGGSDYYSEAKRLASKVRGTMRSSDGGYVWAHEVGSRSGCQPMTYVKYTTSALADLSTASSSLFDSSFMKRVAYTMARKALKSSSGTSLADNICGSGSYGSANMFNEYPYAQLAPWDSSGRLETAAERVYAAVERRSSTPKTSNLAAIMVFTKGR